MSFEYNVVTSAGAQLIANATAANPIVIVRCLSSTEAASSLDDLAGKSQSFYDGKSGSIFTSSAHDNVARIIMNFANDTNAQSQVIKSACIIARLQSQDDSQSVIMAALSDPNSTITIPPSTSPLTHIHIPINIAINADEQVATVGAEYASAEDLDRFVSAHAAGTPTAGDEQDIYGKKTFRDDVVFEDDSSFGGIAVFNDDVMMYSDLQVGGELGAEDSVLKNIQSSKIKAQNPSSVGLTICSQTPENAYSHVMVAYSEQLGSTPIVELKAQGDTQSISAGISVLRLEKNKISFGLASPDLYYQTSGIEIKPGSNMSLLFEPINNNEVVIGSESKRIKDAFYTNIHTSSLTATGSIHGIADEAVSAQSATRDSDNNIISERYVTSMTYNSGAGQVVGINGKGQQIGSVFQLDTAVAQVIKGGQYGGGYGQIGLFSYSGGSPQPIGTIVAGNLLRPMTFYTNEAVTQTPQSITLSLYQGAALSQYEKWVLLTPAEFGVTGSVCVVLAVRVYE